MLRNTFVLAAYTLARPQLSIRKCGEIALRKVVNAVPAISGTQSFRALSQVKGFSTSVPNLQKDE